jgi:hypothetical protein
MSALKKCFVVAPIGDDSTAEKKAIKEHSDTVLEFIINPVITQLGFEEGKRADHLGIPGDINRQIIDRIVNDDLVIADLTGHNPNVFYELALRHAVRRPYVHLIKKGQSIPFDLAPKRTVFIDPDKVREVERAKSELRGQVETCMASGFVVESPLSDALNYDRLNEGDARDRSIAILLNQVEWLVQQEKGRQQTKLRQQAEAIVALGADPADSPVAIVDSGLNWEHWADWARDMRPHGIGPPTPWHSVRNAARTIALRFAKQRYDRDLTPEQLESVLMPVRQRIKGVAIDESDLSAAIVQELVMLFGAPTSPGSHSPP